MKINKLTITLIALLIGSVVFASNMNVIHTKAESVEQAVNHKKNDFINLLEVIHDKKREKQERKMKQHNDRKFHVNQSEPVAFIIHDHGVKEPSNWLTNKPEYEYYLQLENPKTNTVFVARVDAITYFESQVIDTFAEQIERLEKGLELQAEPQVKSEIELYVDKSKLLHITDNDMYGFGEIVKTDKQSFFDKVIHRIKAE